LSRVAIGARVLDETEARAAADFARLCARAPQPDVRRRASRALAALLQRFSAGVAAHARFAAAGWATRSERADGSAAEAAALAVFSALAQRHAATLGAGRVGVLHGSKSYVLADEDGAVLGAHSSSAGLDYPGVGPEHAYLKDSGRARYVSVTDDEALAALRRLAEREGILCALETAHAIAAAERIALDLGPGKHLVVNCSGRGDKDMGTVARVLGVTLGKGR
jgi:tryptophan synthase beta subunit